ncbi:MAG TPA: aminotransferase class I/II-fold pyridoxal phosphate-dependent enzyme [Clostridiaceae bacterium]|nr:aminotransferase class I/II-fold pyridoxal phosphate-dependent enzyme [Clostridiaceae bacterium]
MNNLSKMPLVETLFAAAAERFSFHMPANRQGKSFPPWLRDKLWTLDNTEIELTGDINHPEGKVMAAMDLAANTFGSGHTRFVTTGTTTSLLTALATACPRGSRIILPRRVHQTIMHGVALLELVPIWAEPEEGEEIEQALIREIKNHPEAQAVFVTTPIYDGTTVPLTNIVKQAREKGIFVIVDEAHGSHFAAAPDLLRPTALSQGADLVAMSAHKTLPALTPGSYLHIGKDVLSSGRISTDRLGQMLKVFQTTSPSFVIAASLDYARYWLETEGRQAVENLLRLISILNRDLPPSLKRLQLPTSDPLRLTYDYSSTGRTRAEVRRIFDAGKVDPEVIDLSQIILIPALDTGDEEMKALASVLCAVGTPNSDFAVGTDEEHAVSLGADTKGKPAVQDIGWVYSLLDRSAPVGVPVGKALFGNIQKQETALREAEGRSAAEAIVPYPPGVALVWPGEIITRERIEAIEQLIAAEITVYGVHNPDMPGVKVIE